MRPSSAAVLGLCRFAAAMAVLDRVTARRALLALRRSRLPRASVEEAALMLVLYAGFPAALEASRLLNQMWPGVARPSRDLGGRARRLRGARLCRRVYGPAFPKLIEHVRGLHPDLVQWMIEDGYGRVLSRPRLGVRERELVTVAVLAATGWRRQLVSHLRGARRVGARPAEIRAAFTVGSARASPSARPEGRSGWREFERLARWRSTAESLPGRSNE